MRATLSLVLTFATGVGCASAVGPGPGDGSGMDAVNNSDRPLLPETIFQPDAPQPVDTFVPFDGIVGRDVITPVPDGGTIEGLWRATAYEATDASGRTLRVTTANTMIPGSPSLFRCNGLLNLTSSRLSLSFGILADDHFYASQSGADPMNPLSAFGFTAPGMLVGSQFEIPFGMAMPIQFDIIDPGTIALNNQDGSRLFFERTTPIPGDEGVMFLMTASFDVDSGEMLPTNPRLALAWDLPMGAQRVVFDTPLMFDPRGRAEAGFGVGTPPPDVQGSLGTTQIAMLYAIAYQDGNNDGALSLSSPQDEVRGISPVALAWRGGTASPEFSRSTVRDLQPGFQFVHVHSDFTGGGGIRYAAAPFDPRSSVQPDLSVSPRRLATAIPDLVR